MFVEKHCHYTGSLPLEFLVPQLLNRKAGVKHHIVEKLLLDDGLPEKVHSPWQIPKSQALVSQNLAAIFGGDWRSNKRLFGEIYNLFQTLSRDNNPAEIERLYSEGSYAIARSFYGYGARHIEIKAGPGKDVDATCQRIYAMDKGFNRFEVEHGLSNFAEVTLTFIRKEGAFQNYEHNLLVGIFKLLESGKLPRVNGFDFSGDETKEGAEEIFEIISRIEEFNMSRLARGLRRYIITVHAGEEFISIDPDFYIDFFSRLLAHDIDRVGHGTFLWIPQRVFAVSPAIDRERQRLLHSLAEHGVELEICPTSNLRLTPLGDIRNIPIQDFRHHHIPFSINTDNCTIFSTNIAREHHLVLRD